MGWPNAGRDIEEAGGNPTLSELMVWRGWGQGGQCCDRATVSSAQKIGRDDFTMGTWGWCFAWDLEEWGGLERQLQAEASMVEGALTGFRGQEEVGDEPGTEHRAKSHRLSRSRGRVRAVGDGAGRLLD